jgi:hypothetical protein
MTYVPEVGQLPAYIVAAMKETNLSPCCAAPLIDGPRGGACVNCWCEKCHARFNVLRDYPVNWGQCTNVQDDEGFDWYAREGRLAYGCVKQ